MSQLPDLFKEYNTSLLPKDAAYFLAISGGLDSVVLAGLMQDAGHCFALVHCNFSLRGEESDGDELFVKELAAKYGKPFYSRRFNTASYASENKCSIQEAARELRYAWFRELLASEAVIEGKPVKYLVTAHHQDDNIETVLMNFFKGTGISGLRGIQPRQPGILRPLLFASRESILQYAQEQRLSWREDSSNISIKYTRNFFRHQVLPLIEQHYPQARTAIAANIARFTEVEVIYKEAIENYRSKLFKKDGEGFRLPVLQLLKMRPLHTIVYEMFHPFGFTAAQAGEIIRLLGSATGATMRSETHRLIRHGRWLLVQKPADKGLETILVEKGQEQVLFSGGSLQLKRVDAAKIHFEGNTVAYVAEKELQFPLILRRWKAGDYFYPLGMRKKKKLSRFFIDQKLSVSQKENAWVLESGGRILWILGQRIDDRFKITSSTKKAWRISLSSL